MFKFVLKSVLVFSFALLLVGFNPTSPHVILFTIGRSKDANELYYSINLDASNNLDQDAPIHIYWIKRIKNNKIEPLTWVQKEFAYGIHYLSKSAMSAKFTFAGYDKRVFELKKNKNDEFKVFTMSNNVEVEVKRIYIYITGGTFWIPEIPKVELIATSSSSSIQMIETIKP